jgi:hypothetical protein
MAGVGPFTSFAFPDVYTQTLNEAPRVTAAGGLRFPAFVGIADETIQYDNYEMFRGTSSVSDNLIVKENVSSQYTGANRNCTVSYYPIVKGDGNGTTTTDPSKVTVYVNGDSVPVASVSGSTGVVNLVSIPATGDEVLISYYFKRSDTLVTDEDISSQADGSNIYFKVSNVPIVQGDNGGITTTDPTKVIVTVNAVAATVSAVDGDTGIITMAAAPLAGTTVLVTYYTNTYQDTSDILPSPYVNSVLKVGYSPGTSDFIEGTDFVLDSTGNFFTLNWGHSYKIASGQHTIATNYFDSTRVSGTLFDNRVYRRHAVGTTDGTNKTFTIEALPMTGQGLGKSTDSPSLVSAYVGTSATDASAAPVNYVDASLMTVTLRSAPAADSTVFVTEYTNILPDDVWTLTNTLAGVSGVGQYTVSGVNSGTAMNVVWSSSTSDTSVASPSFATENVTYPAGTGATNSDAQVMPGYAVAETVHLTFTDSSSYVVTSTNSAGTGTAGDNTGHLNQTYIDAKTGFRVTVNVGATVVYQALDKIGYTVSGTFTTAATPTRAIPGIRTTVTNTTGVGVGDTATLTTYNKSGAEPNIGDFFYVTFLENKQTFNEAELFTLERSALQFTGPLSSTNKLGLAAHLAFMNGAAAVALLQVQRSTGGEDAPDSAYIAGIDYFNQPMPGGVQPALMEPVTTSRTVLSYLKTSNTIQSGIRYMNERMSYFGFPINTSPTTAQTYAKSMLSERMTGIYPDGGITTIPDALGNDIEYLVDGAFFAACIAGRDTSPAYDVATPLTRKPIVGFSRLYRRLDTVTQAQTCNAGLSMLEEQAAGIIIKMDLTTDLSSVLTRTPSVIRIKDFVQKGARSILQPYIGSKFLASRTAEIEETLGSYLSALKNAQIIAAYGSVKATVDPNDATTINVEAFYSPILPLLYIVITFNLKSKM